MAQRAGEVGERGLIDLIWRSIIGEYPEHARANLLAHPDDASALQLPEGRYLVLKTDMFVKRTDAPRGMRHDQMGRKSVVMNLSDLAAKGARPSAFMYSLGIPPNYLTERVLGLVGGIASACCEYGMPLLGGDLGESSDLVVAGFAVGVASRLVKRSGASPGDILAVTGPFGDTASALKILLEGLEAPGSLRAEVCRRLYRPEARVQLGVALAESGVATSCMDSSDGLAYTIAELAKSSRVGFEVSSVPASEAASKFASLHRLPVEELVFYGGEEYELVFTVKPSKLAEAQRVASGAGGQVIPIGKAVEGSAVLLKDGSGWRKLQARGWEHLK